MHLQNLLSVLVSENLMVRIYTSACPVRAHNAEVSLIATVRFVRYRLSTMRKAPGGDDNRAMIRDSGRVLMRPGDGSQKKTGLRGRASLKHCALMRSAWKKIARFSGGLALLLGFLFLLAHLSGPRPQCLNGSCRDGFGTRLYADESRYSGEFLDGRPTGKGTLRTKTGEVYSGEWRQGKKHGLGVVLYADGSRYAGAFAENVKEGQGQFRWPDGTTLTGTWLRGEPEGVMRLMLPDGTQLIGVYRGGQIFQGDGIRIFSDGTQYVGQWRDGKKHGRGTLIGADGKIISTGAWRDNTFVPRSD